MLNTRLSSTVVQPVTEPGRWLWFALACLLIGSLMAVVLVLAKTPALAALGLDGVFPVALVYHVNFTILFWVSAVAVLIWRSCFTARSTLLDRLALLLAVAAAAVLLLQLPDSPRAVLSNYVPVVDSASFLSGLLLYVAAVSLIVLNRAGAIIRALVAEPQGPHWLFGLAALAWLTAVLVLGLSLVQLSGETSLAVEAELLFWGFGHSLQGVNLLLMVGGWVWLSGYRCGFFVARCLQWGMLSAFVLVVLLAGTYPPASAAYRLLFIEWMRFFSLPVLLLLVVPLWLTCHGTAAGRLVRASMALFVLGALLGASIRADNLLVPAHYHATTGALNLILMALLIRLQGGAAFNQVVRGPLTWYGAGVLMLVGGLALSGWMGLGRKLPAVEQGLESVAQYAALSLMSVGGAVALAACFLFWWRAARLPRFMPMTDKSGRKEAV